MNIITTVKYAFSVLKEGNQFSHVEGWKNVQLVTNLLYLVFTITVQFLPQLGVIESEELATTINLLATTIAAVINSYLTVATTEKIGLKNKEEVISEEETEVEEEEVVQEKRLLTKKEIQRKELPKKETPKEETPFGFNDKYN